MKNEIINEIKKEPLFYFFLMVCLAIFSFWFITSITPEADKIDPKYVKMLEELESLPTPQIEYIEVGPELGIQYKAINLEDYPPKGYKWGHKFKVTDKLTAGEINQLVQTK